MDDEPPRAISPHGLWEWDEEAWSWVPRQGAPKREPEWPRRAAWIAGGILGLAVLSIAVAGLHRDDDQRRGSGLVDRRGGRQGLH